MFRPSKSLRTAVRSGDRYAVQAALNMYFSKYPGDVELLTQATKYALNNRFEPFAGSKPEADESKWDEKYYAMAQVKLMSNFSRERFEHVLAVGQFVFGTVQKKWSNHGRLLVAALGVAVIALGAIALLKD